MARLGSLARWGWPGLSALGSAWLRAECGAVSLGLARTLHRLCMVAGGVRSWLADQFGRQAGAMTCMICQKCAILGAPKKNSLKPPASSTFSPLGELAD